MRLGKRKKKCQVQSGICFLVLDEWLLMVTVRSVEFSRTSQLCQLVSQGFSLCYQLQAGKKMKWGKKFYYSLCLSRETLPFLLATIPPLGTESRTVLFMSFGMEIGKKLCITKDSWKGVIDHDDFKINRENGG